MSIGSTVSESEMEKIFFFPLHNLSVSHKQVPQNKATFLCFRTRTLPAVYVMEEHFAIFRKKQSTCSLIMNAVARVILAWLLSELCCDCV